MVESIMMYAAEICCINKKRSKERFLPQMKCYWRYCEMNNESIPNSRYEIKRRMYTERSAKE